MLVRIFGLFGIILGAAYLKQGVDYVDRLSIALEHKFNEAFIYYALFVTWDFLFGTTLIVAAIGVLLLREWGRFMWLGLLPALLVVHFGVIVYYLVSRGRVSDSYLIWTAMVLAVTALSWWYMTKEKTRSRFSREKNEPAVAEE